MSLVDLDPHRIERTVHKDHRNHQQDGRDGSRGGWCLALFEFHPQLDG